MRWYDHAFAVACGAFVGAAIFLAALMGLSLVLR